MLMHDAKHCCPHRLPHKALYLLCLMCRQLHDNPMKDMLP